MVATLGVFLAGWPSVQDIESAVFAERITRPPVSPGQTRCRAANAATRPSHLNHVREA
jgi:hypothetical protein